MADPKDDDKLEKDLKDALKEKEGADKSGVTAAGKAIKVPGKNGKSGKSGS
jgi:hypothetical protein